MDYSSYLNRTLCDVLEEMRKCGDTRNYSYLPGLIEEAQSMANRMEAKLEDVRDFERLKEGVSKMNKEMKALKEERAKLKEEVDELKGD